MSVNIIAIAYLLLTLQVLHTPRADLPFDQLPSLLIDLRWRLDLPMSPDKMGLEWRSASVGHAAAELMWSDLVRHAADILSSSDGWPFCSVVFPEFDSLGHSSKGEVGFELLLKIC